MSLFDYADLESIVFLRQKGGQDCGLSMAGGTLASSSPKWWKETWEWGMHFNESFP